MSDPDRIFAPLSTLIPGIDPLFFINSGITSQNNNSTLKYYYYAEASDLSTFDTSRVDKLKKDFIDTGHVKLEFRHFPLDIAALNAAKIAQCKKDQSLEILESLYFNQQDWVKGSTIEEVNNKSYNLFVIVLFLFLQSFHN